MRRLFDESGVLLTELLGTGGSQMGINERGRLIQEDGSSWTRILDYL